MSIIDRKLSWVNKISIRKLILIAYCINLSTAILFGYVLFPDENANPDNLSIGFFFIAGVLVGPFLETWLVQYTIMEYGYKWTKKYWPGFVLSIVVFSALHHYSVPYMLKTLISGTVYTSVYFVCMIRKWNGFLYTSCVHMLYNFTVLIVNYFIDA
ncbi:hypothetical protein KACHI17_22600 [Sediminibacterium sp. KACHI17]|jgi:hypothetical protein|uniref:CAAX prenyl protease 2/Lysostaphin resistance protein A-like domain-containing protein n=1 Tax=Sediminibacterium sp. KACHI17 TaxID=1751071 RepID=A0AAT9GL07_9BACT